MILHAFAVITLMGEPESYEFEYLKDIHNWLECFQEAHILAADEARRFTRAGEEIQEISVVCRRMDGEST